MRQVVEILPNRALYRVNLASYAELLVDFRDRRTRGARTIAGAGRQRPDRAGVRPGRTGAAGTGDGNLPRSLARSATRRVARDIRSRRPGQPRRAVSRSGANSRAGAARIWRPSVRPGRREVRRARPYRVSAATAAAAIAAADKALQTDNAVKIRFLAARAFVEAGAIEKARPLVAGAGLRAPGRAAGLRQDRRRRDRAERRRPRGRRSKP